MKKKILTLLLIACQTLAFAEGSALLVTKKDGTKVGFILSEKPVVTFGSTTLNIKTAEVSTDFERADISTFTFVPESEVNSIREMNQENQLYEYRDGTIHAEGTTIQIYTIDGQMVKSATDRLSLSDAPSGIYIVKANRQTLKINKK